MTKVNVEINIRRAAAIASGKIDNSITVRI